MHDGAIVFNTKIDNADVEKDLKATERKIRKAEESITKSKNARLPLVKQAEELGARLDAAKQKAEQLKATMSTMEAAMAPGSDPADYLDAYANYGRVRDDLTAQQREVDNLQKQWDKVNDKVEDYDRKIEESRKAIQRSTAEVGRLRAKLSKGGTSLSGVFDKAEKSADRFRRRILSIGASALVFNVLSSGLRSAVGYMGKILRTNAQYNAQLAQLKAALLAAFQPIYEFILPGLITVMKVLTTILTLFGKFLAWIFGKNYSDMVQNSQNLYNQANALDAVASAAKAAKKELAGFDEINRIGKAEDISVGTGTGGGSISPDFGSLNTGTDEVEDSLRDIFELVAAIGAGLLAWKIASAFTDNLKMIAGIALAVGGALLYAFNWADAFANGIDWENLVGMLTGALALVVGLTLAFGATGGAIGLLITGLGLLGLALYEWMETGELTVEALFALELGFLFVGAAISLLTGTWIPLLIAALAGLVTAVFLDADMIREKLQELDNWLQGIFTTDWRNTFGPVLGGILNQFCAVVKNVWDNVLRPHFEGWINFLNGVFTGNWSMAWNGIKQIFSSAMNALPGFARNAMSSIASAVQSAIGWIESLIAKIRSIGGGSSVHRSLSGLLHGGGGGFFAKGGTLRSGWGIVGEVGPELIQMVNGNAVITPLNIPRLAKGAVLPPNAPFMAMVGDQKHGTNIEAPLTVIQEAVAAVLGDQEDILLAGFEAVVQAIREKNMSVHIGDRDIGEANARYVGRMAVRRGTG